MSRIKARCKKASALRFRFSPILGKPPTSIQPGKSALNNPAFWQALESFGASELVDLHRKIRKDLAERSRIVLIAGIGEQFLQKRKHPEQGGHDKNAALRS